MHCSNELRCVLLIGYVTISAFLLLFGESDK